MDKIFVTATSQALGEEVSTARLGTRFGRMDLLSQLALLAVEKLGVNFDELPRDRIAICLAAPAGSLSTDAEYWKGRDQAGGPSPTLFTYTLPSAPLGEIAIRHRLTGPNLCFISTGGEVLDEATELLRQGEADGCVCICANVVSPTLAGFLGTSVAARASAAFLRRGGAGGHELGQLDRDLETLCASVRPKI
jgi:3-oxoacyl-(acyl-carrier-protein) synthase